MQLMHVMANTDEMLMRESQSTFSIPIQNTGAGGQYVIQFEISNSYMNQILLQLFLTFFLTMIVMLVMMAEVNKLPRLWLEKDMAPEMGQGSDGSHMCIRDSP